MIFDIHLYKITVLIYLMSYYIIKKLLIILFRKNKYPYDIDFFSSFQQKNVHFSNRLHFFSGVFKSFNRLFNTFSPFKPFFTLKSIFKISSFQHSVENYVENFSLQNKRNEKHYYSSFLIHHSTF